MKKWKILNALDLKLLAMALMLCDHLWATLFPYHQWLTNLGRLAFPIFAFQVVEGFFHTHDLKNYQKRMLLFALISEIPFNLMTAGGLVNPFHQNVMFTFSIGLFLMNFLEKQKDRSLPVCLFSLLSAVVGGYLMGLFTFVDYFGYGVLTVLVFYLFHGKKGGKLGILISMILINVGFMEGLTYPITLFGISFDFPQQGFAVLALIPIFLYNGKQGPHSRAIQYACYGFYPLHMLILAVIWLALT